MISYMLIFATLARKSKLFHFYNDNHHEKNSTPIIFN